MQAEFVNTGHVGIYKATKAYHDADYDSFFIDDHVPHAHGDTERRHRGRAFAGGYITAIIEAVKKMRRSTDSKQLLDLTRYESVRIKQRVEPLEMFTGFESRNSYDLHDPSGNVIAHAAESTSGMQRLFLGSGRFESVELRNTSGDPILKLKERWSFPFSTHAISTGDGQPWFQIKQRFAILKRKFSIWGDGNPDMSIRGPRFRPWTFWVDEGNTQVGKITKRFSGIGTEMFTDADNFDIEFLAPVAHQEQRMRMLVMGFVIDLKFFENKGNRGSGFRFGS